MTISITLSEYKKDQREQHLISLDFEGKGAKQVYDSIIGKFKENELDIKSIYELKAKDFLTLNMIPIKTVPGTAASIVPMDVYLSPDIKSEIVEYMKSYQ